MNEESSPSLLNVDTSQPPTPILYKNETLDGMLIRFVEIKRDQYKWITHSEESLRSLWKVPSSNSESATDLRLRQLLLSLKREFSRTIKSERQLLRDFSIACGLSIKEIPKYFSRGYDIDSPVARRYVYTLILFTHYFDKTCKLKKKKNHTDNANALMHSRK